jgi:hydroxyacylglutathione hydrolase
MLTGDTLYPGLLVVNDWPAYRTSARRLAAFVRSQEVTWCLGAHIEMGRSGQVFVPPTTFQPDEHSLQLSAADLLQWAEACERLDSTATGRHTFASFVIDIR